jgi:2-haloacid dehalogenase
MKDMKRREFLLGSAAVGAVSPLLAARASAEPPAPIGESVRAGGEPARPEPDTMRGVQLLVFDTFGTVVDWRSAVIAEGEKLGRDKGLTVDWAAFADAWRGGYAPALNRVRSGALPWTKLDVLHRMTLDELIVQFKLAGLDEDEKRHFNNVWHRLHGWPDSVAGLTRLRKRYVIAPLSNGNVSLLTGMAKFAGLPWDCILSTELVRHYKPDKETYLMPGEFWDLPPSAVMMVAAHPGDLDAARALGLRTAYVHRPLEYGPTRPSRMPPADAYDFAVHDLKELASRLSL